MKKLALLILPLFLFFAISPGYVSAQIGPDDDIDSYEDWQNGNNDNLSSCTSIGGLGDVVDCALQVMQALVLILIAVAFIVTIWCAIRFIGAEPGEDRKRWRSSMINGIIALAVILSIWGLVSILRSAFGLSAGGTAPETPGLWRGE